MPFADAGFVAYVDSADEGLREAVKQAALALPFPAVTVHFSDWDPPADTGKRNAVPRRTRHAIMREASKTLIGDGEVLLLEDDTEIPPLTYGPLSETRKTHDWAIGAEVHRWGSTRPVGVWRFRHERGKPVEQHSLMPGQGVEKVDATGLYCVLTSAETYRKVDFGTWNDTVGHDAYTTWQLTLAGLSLAVDWRVPCAHLTQTERITIADARLLSRPLASLDVRTLATRGEEPEPGPERTYKLGKSVTLGGKVYPRGSRANASEVLAMHAAGLISNLPPELARA